MGRTRKIAGGLIVGAAVVAGALVAGPAFAATGGTGHTVTMTSHQHGTFEDDGATNPCTGEAGIAVFDGNSVAHETYFPAGDEVWFTFTETGKVTFTSDGVTFYTGHATAWGNFNMNEQNSNETFTLTIHAVAPDGSTIDGHEVSHLTMNANGDITVTFDKLSFTCS
jgi:hypothetical protein